MKRIEENYAEFFKKVNSMYLDCEKKKNITILHLTSSVNIEML